MPGLWLQVQYFGISQRTPEGAADSREVGLWEVTLQPGNTLQR